MTADSEPRPLCFRPADNDGQVASPSMERVRTAGGTDVAMVIGCDRRRRVYGVVVGVTL
jgi:hypothetical protein